MQFLSVFAVMVISELPTILEVGVMCFHLAHCTETVSGLVQVGSQCWFQQTLFYTQEGSSSFWTLMQQCRNVVSMVSSSMDGL